MKKRLTTLFLLAGMLAASAVTAHAETYYGEEGWHVAFTQEEKMESNFTTQDLSEAAAGLQPGDDIHLSVAIENSHKEATDWYMKNDIRESLEDASSTAAGGAYTYILTYTDSAGKTTELFNSDTVGGEDVSEAGEGLNEATSALDEYFYLDNLTNGETGKVDLTVALEGETQGNDYQDTLAELEMAFAVELAQEPEQAYNREEPEEEVTETQTETEEEPETPAQTEEPQEETTVRQPGDSPDSSRSHTRVQSVKTGDTEVPVVSFMLMAACGIVLLFFAVRNVRENRKDRKGGA